MRFRPSLRRWLGLVLTAKCAGLTLPARAEGLSQLTAPQAFTPQHQTVWQLAVQPHEAEIEFIVGTVEQLLQVRDREGTQPTSVALQTWRAQLLTDARNMLRYCLQRNPNQAHALTTATMLEHNAGNNTAAQHYAARFFASQQLDPVAPELGDDLSGPMRAQIGNVLLITALQAMRRNEPALALTQLRMAALATQSQDAPLPQLITLVLAECLQQQNYHTEVQQRLRNFAPATLQIMVVAVALDRRERDSELAELSNQHREVVLQELATLGPALAQLPQHEGTYYRALALEITGQRAAARDQWLLYLSDHNAHWRQRAQVHVDRLDAAVRAAR